MSDLTIAGPPGITRQHFAAILDLHRSPAVGEAAAIYDALVSGRVRPEVFLAFWWVESQFGRLGVQAAYDTHNPGNVRTPEIGSIFITSVDTPRGRFAKYPDWQSGATDWAERLKGPRYAGAGLTTVRQVLPKYAPASDSNDPAHYADAVIDLATQWAKEGSMVNKPTVVSKPSPNRGGYAGARRVDAVVWHVTAGSGPSSLGWLTNPASQASANYLIDKDGTTYELVPPNEDAWANGAVNKPDTGNRLIARWLQEGANFNQRTVSIETVRETSAMEQPGGFTEAQHRALVALSAWLCATYGLAADRTHIIRHGQIDSVNRPHCPGLAESEMVAWIGEIAALVDGPDVSGQTPAPQPPAPPADPGFPGALTAGGHAVINGVDFEGQAVSVEEVTVRVRNAAGARFQRTWAGHQLQPWEARP